MNSNFMFFKIFFKTVGACAVACAAATASAADFSVSTYSELASALSKVIQSNTDKRTVIELEPGSYGASASFYNRQPLGEVVIKSKTPSSPAVFERVKVNQSKNITFDGIKFIAPYGKETEFQHVRALEINDSVGISVVNSQFQGDRVNLGEGKANDAGNKALRREDAIEGFAIGAAIIATRSEDIRFVNNTLDSFRIGAQFTRMKNLVVEGNDIRNTRMDAFNFAQVENGRIVGNKVVGMTPWVGPGDQVNPSIGDHSDMIQFWTDATDEPSKNILIANNYLSSPVDSDVNNTTTPASYYVQGIFIRNEKVDTGKWPSSKQYQGVKICGNYVATAHVHGITATDVDGLQVLHNHIHSIPFEGGYTAKANFKWVDKPAVRPSMSGNRLAGDINVKMEEAGGYVDVSERLKEKSGSIRGKASGDAGSPPRLTYEEFINNYGDVHKVCLGEVSLTSL